MRQPVMVVVAMALSGLVPPLSAEAQEPQTQVATIVTNGVAVLRRAPDQAFVVVTVETRAKSPRDAQGQNAAVTSTVRGRLG